MMEQKYNKDNQDKAMHKANCVLNDLPKSAQPTPSRSELTVADYEEVLADHRRLVRELDVALNGEENAAKQASLCDIVAQVKHENWKLVSPSQSVVDERDYEKLNNIIFSLRWHYEFALKKAIGMPKEIGYLLTEAEQIFTRAQLNPQPSQDALDAERWRMARTLGIAVVNAKGNITGAHFNEGADMRVDSAMKEVK